MTAEVVELRTVTRLDLPVERIINGASKAGLTEVIVIGFDADGEFYFAANKASGADALWLLETAKRRLMALADDD